MLTRRAAIGLAGLAPFAGLVGAAGCAAPAPTTGSPASAPPASLASVARGLGRALEEGDREGFVGMFEAPLRTQATVLFDNAGRLGSFTLDEDPLRQGLRIRWRVGAERDQSTALFTARISADGRVRALGDPSGGAPSWWRHRVVVTGRGPTWLVAAEGRAEASVPWLDAAGVAREHVRAARLVPWADAWDGTLVVEVPHDLLGFASRPVTAAYVTFPLEEDGGRVVLNPTLLGRFDQAGRVGLLVHEGVHVVTRVAFMDAPQWVVEGLAEHVATQVWPAAADDNRRRIREVLDAGAPTDLPRRKELRGADTLTAYALAAVAVEACLERWGREDALAWMAAWSVADRPPDDEIRSAYLARLRNG